MARIGGNPNLKPPEHAKFKPGQSGNKSGKSKLQLEVESKVRLGNNEIKLFLIKCLDMTKDELAKYLSRKETTMFEIVLGKLIIKAASGELQALSYLLDRTYGKPKDMQVAIGTVVYQTSVSDNGAISCDAIDVEADTQTAFKTLETYSENNTAETAQRNTTGNL